MKKRNVYASVLKNAIEDMAFRSDVLKLEPEHFPDKYQQVFEAMRMQTDFSDLSLKQHLETFGHDPAIIDDILSEPPSTSKVGDMSYVIEQKNKKDLYIKLKDTFKELPNVPYQDIMDSIRNIVSSSPSGKLASEDGDAVANDLLEDIKLFRTGKKTPYLITGMPIFDDKARLSRNKYVLLASQRKMGKTKFVINLTKRLMKYNKNVNVLYISLEMTKKEIVTGYISSISGIEEDEIISSKNSFNQDQFDLIEKAARQFGDMPFKIYDSPMNLSDLYNVCSNFCKGIPPDNIPIIVIDNIGLIRPNKKSATEFEDEIARTIKDIRDDCACLVLAIHHLSKSSETDANGGYEPKIAHVRGSSRLLDFCNTLMLLHRPGFYNDVVEMGDGMGIDIRQMFVVNIALQRSGGGGYVPMYCDLSTNRFEESNRQ